MPIYRTNQFWDYLSNESIITIREAKKLLTHLSYNFDTQNYDKSYYWQTISKLEIDGIKYETIRFPGGLTSWLANKLSIGIEEKSYLEYEWDEDEILAEAEKVKLINPDYEIRDYQLEAVETSLNNFRSLINASVGSGKEQPCDIIIPTPDGFKKFGDLKIGNRIFGLDGKSQFVTGIFPQGKKDVYKISFQNGATVECGLEHLWTVRKNHGKNKVITLKDMLNNYYKLDSRGFKRYLYSVDYIEPVEYAKKEYFIDPYILGILIGDGTLTTENIGFSCPDNEIEIVQRIIKILPKTHHLQANRYPACPQYYIRMSTPRGKGKYNLYKKEIKRLNLNVKSHLKFIPDEYMLGSIQQRKDLLAGLLDADGCCRKRKKHCSITYGTVSEKLAQDIQKLVFSLGGAATIRSYKRKNKRKEFEVRIELLFNPFLLNRKKSNFVPYRITNTIINIEKIRTTECMCIKVSNEDELYITQNYIPTHNTSIMALVCKCLINNNKILILNGNNLILGQIAERLASFGITDVSWKEGEEPDFAKSIVVMNIANSDSHLNRQDEKYINYLKNDVKTIIYDEAHHLQSLTAFEPILYTNPDNLKHLIGYSGSPFRNRKDPYKTQEDFRTVAIIGEPNFNYEMKDAIKAGSIAQPYGYFIRYPNKACFVPKAYEKNYNMQYRANITYNKARNKAGFEMLKFLNQYGIKTFASVNNTKAAQNKMKELKEIGINSLLICGNNTIYEWGNGPRGGLKLEKRKGGKTEVINALNNNYNIIFGTSVLDEGVSIDIFQAAVLFSAGKTNIAGIQRLGRASRKRINGQNVSFVIDFQDIGGYPTFEQHYLERREMMIDSGIKIFDNVLNFIDFIKRISEENKKD